VAEVEVERETGQVRVTRLVSVQDIGTVLNPRLAQGQVEGGIVTGLGYAVMEDLRVEDGRVLTAHLGDYKLPCAADVPVLEQAFLPDGEGPAPFGSKPVGEVSLCGVAPAIANAIQDAVGVRITDLPLTAEKVHRRLRLREKGSQG
jgi:CO/xanthine dehydrogenase Mo-binding subunit